MVSIRGWANQMNTTIHKLKKSRLNIVCFGILTIVVLLLGACNVTTPRVPTVPVDVEPVPITETPPVEETVTTPPEEETPPVTTPPVEETPPVATPPVEETPPVTTPPVEETPPVTTPPEEETPPVTTPPEEETPPVTTPPVEETPPVTVPPVPNVLAHPVPQPDPALFPYPNAFTADNETEQAVGNLLVNPSFTDQTGWSNCGTPESAAIANGALSIDTGVCFFQNVDIEAAPANQTYTLTCRGAMEKPTYSVFILSMLDSNFQTLETKSQTINTSNRQWRIDLSAPADTRFVTVGFYTETGATYDYCTLTDGTPPPLSQETVFAPTKKLELLLPIYIDPAQSIVPWNQAIANAATIPTTIVVNPVIGGIAGCQTQSFKNTLTNVQNANIDTVGYVATGYTARNIAEVKADIDKFVACEGIDGVFFDEVKAETAAEATYYQDICSYAKSAFIGESKLIINPGTNVSLSFTNDFCNINMLYENFSNTWADFAVFGYEGAATDPAKAVMLHTAIDIPEMKRVVDLAYSRKLDYIYVTSTTVPNPWTELTSYYTEFSEYLALKNSGIN